MSDPVVIQACAAADFDASAGVCTHPIWIPQPSLLPDLDVVSAVSISIAVGVLWATAFGFRSLRKISD